MKKAIFATILATLTATTANAGFLDKVDKALSNVNKALGVVNGTSTSTASSSSSADYPQFAPMTDAQKQKIESHFNRINTGNQFLDQYILEAKGNIIKLLSIASCQSNKGKLAIGSIRSSGSDNIMIHNVLSYTDNHPLTQCMTVTTLGNWRQSGRDRFHFSVIYASDISGESQKRDVSMVKEGGQWLVVWHAM